MDLCQRLACLIKPNEVSVLTCKHLLFLKGWMANMLCLARCFLAWILYIKLKLKEDSMECRNIKLWFYSGKTPL